MAHQAVFMISVVLLAQAATGRGRSVVLVTQMVAKMVSADDGDCRMSVSMLLVVGR